MECQPSATPICCLSDLHRPHDGLGQGLPVVSPITPCDDTHALFHTSAHVMTHMIYSAQDYFQRGQLPLGVKYLRLYTIL